MDDLISKTSVCEIIADIYLTDGEKVVAVKEIDKAYEAIQQLPSAQPEQRWISCSERLPENKSYVLTTIYVPGRQPHARSGWFEDGLFMNDNGDTWKSTDREVCAWMPLPAPYHEESKSDE